MPALLQHPSALSISALPLSSSTATPLALPSRFPAGCPPLAAAAASSSTSTSTSHSNIYVYARGAPVVWEYDSKGRRLSEINAGSKVDDVAVLGAGLVAARSAGEVKVWRRAGKKWAVERVLEAPQVCRDMAGGDGVLVLLGAEAWAYDASGTRTVLPDTGSCARIVTPDLVALATDSGIKLLSLGSPSAVGLTLDAAAGGEVVDIAVSSSNAQIAIAAGSCISVMSASTTGGTPTTATFPWAVESVAFLGENTLAVTVDGRMYVHDLETGGTTQVPLEQPVVRVVSLPPRGPRQSEQLTQRARVLSNSSVPNAVSHEENQPEKPKVKTKDEKENPAQKAPRPRSTSGKMPPPPLPLPKANTIPHLSKPSANPLERLQVPVQQLRPPAAPLATPSNPMLAPRSNGTADTLRIRPMDDSATGAGDQTAPSPAVTLPPTPTPAAGSGPGPGWDAFEEMRHEIANLQLDMLRMGRGLKNEIRSAVAPLVEELRASRETIAKQQAEIERLRRGLW